MRDVPSVAGRFADTAPRRLTRQTTDASLGDEAEKKAAREAGVSLAEVAGERSCRMPVASARLSAKGEVSVATNAGVRRGRATHTAW